MTPCYTHAELVPLIGGHRGLAAALQRLSTIGFVTWRSDAIGFGLPELSGPGRIAFDTMLARIPRRRCDLPVPRRVLRFIAGGCRRFMFATLLGHLLTCLTYGQGQCHSGGYCTASWIATTFGVSLRSVKAARRHLLAIDLLQVIPTSCLVRNRLGLKLIINLQWTGPHGTASSATYVHECDNRKLCTEAAGGTTRTQPKPETSNEQQPSVRGVWPMLPSCAVRVKHDTEQRDTAPLSVGQHHQVSSMLSERHKLSPSTPPEVHEPAPLINAQKLFCEEENNQKPASSGSAGRLSTLVRQAQADLKAGRLPRYEELRIAHHAVTARAQPQPTAEPERVTQPPTLQRITRQDLRDMGRLLSLYEQAVDRGWIGRAEADRLTFVALVQHVLLYRPQNPGGLLHRLLTKRLFHYVTQEDEDQALARLKAYEREHGMRHFSDTERSTRRA
jgi:hypothetical protein